MGTPSPETFDRKIAELVDLVGEAKVLKDRYRTLHDMAYSPYVGDSAKVQRSTPRPTEDVALAIESNRRSIRADLSRIVSKLDEAIRAMKRVQGPLDRMAGGGLREQPAKVSADALVTQREFDQSLARRDRRA